MIKYEHQTKALLGPVCLPAHLLPSHFDPPSPSVCVSTSTSVKKKSVTSQTCKMNHTCCNVILYFYIDIYMKLYSLPVGQSVNVKHGEGVTLGIFF